MNNKHQENGALTGSLIFTLPVFSLNLDWLDGTGWAAVFANSHPVGLAYGLGSMRFASFSQIGPLTAGDFGEADRLRSFDGHGF